MKRLFYLFSFFTLFFISKAEAQTSITITAAGDTAWPQSYCTAPIDIEMYIYGKSTGYNPGDIMTIVIDYGDGTDTTVTTTLSTNLGFGWSEPHTYTSNGIFSTNFTVTGPDANSTSLYKQDDVFIDDTCITSLSIDWVNDSIYLCNVNYNWDFYVAGYAFNYESSDLIKIDINYGDGHDTTVYTGITSWSYFSGGTVYKYSAPGNYSLRYIITAPDGKADTIYGQAIVNNTCASISGTLYMDNNNDCIYNTGDNYLSAMSVALKSGSTIIATTYTDYNGNYYFTGVNGTAYTIEVQYTDSSYYNYYIPSCPSSGSVSFTAGTSNNYDFAFNCNNTAFDLQGSLSGWGFRPGFEGYIYINVFNPTCMAVSGTATLTLDPLLTYTGTSYGTQPTSSSGNTLTWDFANLQNDFSWYSGLNSQIGVTTSLTAQLGDSVCLTLSISPISGDSDPLNNTITQCYEVRNSWDPNMKEVAPQGSGASGDVSQDTDFTYKVHFQNTGNDVAYNIHIIDTIDADLDMSTLRIISGSHNMNPYIVNGNVIKFDFPNIMLPDSNSNEPASHGVVVYKIKAKPALSYGTQFKNTAHIYFDFNPAIVTNTTINTIPWPLDVKENLINDKITIFPNPTTGLITLNTNKENPVERIMLYSLEGKKVFEKIESSNTGSISIEIQNLSQGIYFLESITKKGSEKVKVVKY